ncbi:carbon-nitrogen hydrolase family protein [Algoriphagus jejuensis]|uniref:Carbon-nitrogen hydrolase family protein n=1 Tax=Algoriphagus jejuensis TaxID=419934 RepID=A0ABP3YBL0_9BACT
MKICVAQIQSIGGDISSNLDKHRQLIHLATAYKADAVFFPELSLTGYEPALAEASAVNPDDVNLDDFQKISDSNKITIGFGMPTKTAAGVRISMIILQPDRERQIYSKQQLHSDEFPYFVAGEKQLILTVAGKKIAPAICYESLQAEHSAHADQLGAELYVASVAKSQEGINKAMVHYPAVAKKFSMPVLMSNCLGYCDNFESVGQSAVWTKQGDLAEQLDDKLEGILVFDTETKEVNKQTL